MDKKKVLFVMSNLNNGGAERSLVNLLQLIDYGKYEVDLLLFQNIGMFRKFVPKEVNIIADDVQKLFSSDLKHRIKHGEFNSYDLTRLLATFMCKSFYGNSLYYKQKRWIKFYKKKIHRLEKKYDVAMAYLHSEPIYYVVDCVDAVRKIGWVHNEYTKTGLNAEIDKEYFSKLDNIVTISDVCANVLKDTFPNLENKINVLPNLTSSKIVKSMADLFYPNEYTEYKKKEDGFIFVSIGRLHEQKGFDYAIESSKRLVEKDIKFKWFILGSGKLLDELNKKRKEFEVEDYIEFIGSRENPYPYLKNADIVVQPSRYEGKSIVIDEAKILAKPIVVTNYTTVRDQINDEEGLVVPIDSKEIADGICKMIKEREMYIEHLKNNEYGNEFEIDKYYQLMGENNR